MSSTSIRIRLFREDPHCFWCGCVTTLDVSNPRLTTLATVDHLYSRQHPARSRRKHMKVLACFGCNQRRNNCESKGIYFMPKLADRIDIARETCATLARAILTSEDTLPTTSAARVKPRPAPVIKIDMSAYDQLIRDAPDWPTTKLLMQARSKAAKRTRKQPTRVICTLEEAVTFARENPAR